MDFFEKAKLAIQLDDLPMALDAVKNLKPAELRKIIQYAARSNSAVARAVIALAEALLLIAQLEQELEETKQELADLRRAQEPSPPSNDDSSPSPF